MEATFRFGIGERFGAVGIVAGAAGMVAGVTFPVAFPEADPAIARYFFEVSAIIIAASLLFFLCDVALHVMRARGIKLGTALTIIGTAFIIIGTIIGLLGAFQLDRTPQQGPATGGRALGNLTNAQLRERTISVAQGLRALQSAYDDERAQASLKNFRKGYGAQDGRGKARPT